MSVSHRMGAKRHEADKASLFDAHSKRANVRFHTQFLRTAVTTKVVLPERSASGLHFNG
jgi:hypothetical protein